MAETVIMPKLGFDMAEGMLVRWVKKVGDPIKKGDVLAEIETDKATVEVESPYTGIVARRIVAENTSVPVGDPIAMITAPDEKLDSVPEPTPKEVPLQTGSAAKETKSTSVASMSVNEEPVSGRDRPASPLARKMASDNQIDLGKLPGSGPNGRIVRKDVEAALSMKTVTLKGSDSNPGQTTSVPTIIPVQLSQEDEHVPVNKLRSAIGRRMVEAKNTIPHFYVTHQFKADRMMELRKQFNEAVPDDQKLSVNDFIIKATALALRSFPNLNASLLGNELLVHGHVNIGVAVALEGGLLTVVVRDADQKSMRMISSEVKEKAARVRQGKVRQEDIEGSTFSISNLGMYGVEEFGAIINPPEAAILAVGSVHEAAVVENGEVKAARVFKATISADHRVTDGVESARFMQELAKYIENPVLMVM
jgi:pyruvate dehydrogenase E2 component (dihydrolipoamide acetyltransferase)